MKERKTRLPIMIKLTISLLALFLLGAGGTYYINRDLTIATDGIPSNCSDEAALKSWIIDNAEAGDEFLTFKKALCQFYRSSYSPMVNVNNRVAQLAINEATLAFLAEAQQAGLPAPHQSHASLVEGLLHCRQAMWLWEPPLTDNGKDNFCLHRKQTKYSLADVSWNLAKGIFSGSPTAGLTTTPTVPTLIQEMTACQRATEDAIDPPMDGIDSYDVLCGTVPLTPPVVATAVDEVMTSKIYPKYLDGSTAPLSAMIERKRQKASSIVKGSDSALVDLNQRANELDAQYLSIKAKVDAQKPAADEAVETYKKAVGEFYAVDGALDQWAQALFDGGPTLDQENSRLTAMAPPPVNLQDLKTQVDNAINEQEKRRASVRRLCEIYFCEVLSQKHQDHRRSLCGNLEFRDNPLCKELHAQVESSAGEPTYVGQLCQDYGLMDPVFIKLNSTANSGSSCFGHGGLTEAPEAPWTPGAAPEPQVDTGISLTYFTDYLDGSGKTFVALYKDGSEVNAVRLKSCSKEQSLALLGLDPATPVNEGIFIWEAWWNGIYSNPYISCKNELDPKLPNGPEDVVFYDVNVNPVMYYIKQADTNRYISVAANCKTMRNYLGVNVPTRRFSQTSQLPQDVLPYRCGNQGEESTVTQLVDDSWNLWRVEPESGWKLSATSPDECSTGTPDRRVGALILSYTKDQKTIYIPVVKVDGCYLNHQAWYYTQAPSISKREENLRLKLGLPADGIAKILPPDLRPAVEKSPFFEICTQNTGCDLKQHYYNHESQMLSTISNSADAIREIINLDGGAKLNWQFSRTDSSTQSQLVTSVTFPECHIGNDGIMGAFGLASQQLNNYVPNDVWYDRMEKRRREFFVKTIDSKTELELPCFTSSECTLEARNETELLGALDAVGCKLDEQEPANGFEAKSLRIVLKDNIKLSKPLIIDGRKFIQEDIRPNSLTLRLFETVSIVGENGKTISAGYDCQDMSSSKWCQDYFAQYNKIPIIASFAMTRNLRLKGITFEAIAENMTALFSWASVISLDDVNTSSSSTADRKDFARVIYGRNKSEFYIQNATINANIAAISLLNSRLAMKESTITAASGQGLLGATDSEIFLYKNVITAKQPVVLKGSQFDEESNSKRRHMEAYESQFVGVNKFETKHCLELKWGPKVWLDQIQFSKCESAVTLAGYEAENYADQSPYPMPSNDQMKAELFLPFYSDTRFFNTIGMMNNYTSDESVYQVKGN